MTTPLSADLLRKMDAYWRAANYLSVGQIYLLDNPLLREPLKLEHVKPRLVGHWGTTPGLNFIYVHLNRVIREHDLNMLYVTGPGHGGPGLVANTYLEGSYTEIYHDISQDEVGMQRLFKQFSFPGGSEDGKGDRSIYRRLQSLTGPVPFSALLFCSPVLNEARFSAAKTPARGRTPRKPKRRGRRSRSRPVRQRRAREQKADSP